MKKLTTISLVLIMIITALSISACGNNNAAQTWVADSVMINDVRVSVDDYINAHKKFEKDLIKSIEIKEKSAIIETIDGVKKEKCSVPEENYYLINDTLYKYDEEQNTLSTPHEKVFTAIKNGKNEANIVPVKSDKPIVIYIEKK